MHPTSPFSQRPIVVPEDLIGRASFIERLRSGSTEAIVLFGGRRTGKTSVLRCLERKENDEAKGVRWVYWDAQELLLQKLGLPGATALYSGEGATLQGEIERHERFVILFDEFDVLVESKTFHESDFAMLRALLNKYDHFSMVLCSSREDPDPDMPGSELLNMFERLHIPALEVESPDDFYRQYLQLRGQDDLYSEGKDLLGKAGEFAHLHPWLLQVAGSAVYAAVSEVASPEEREDAYFSRIRENMRKVEDNLARVLDGSLSPYLAALFGVAVAAGDISSLSYYQYEATGLVLRGKVPGALEFAVLGRRPERDLAAVPPAELFRCLAAFTDDFPEGTVPVANLKGRTDVLSLLSSGLLKQSAGQVTISDSGRKVLTLDVEIDSDPNGTGRDKKR